jgi:hypothetical protein
LPPVPHRAVDNHNDDLAPAPCPVPFARPGYQMAVQRRDPDAAEALSVAIVGLGPRGLSVLERLLVNLRHRPPARPVVIWAIDPVEHGPGRVWRTDQPGWLATNATAGEITVRSPDIHLLELRADRGEAQ